MRNTATGLRTGRGASRRCPAASESRRSPRSTPSCGPPCPSRHRRPDPGAARPPRIEVVHQHPQGGFLLPAAAGDLRAAGRAHGAGTGGRGGSGGGRHGGYSTRPVSPGKQGRQGHQGLQGRCGTAGLHVTISEGDTSVTPGWQLFCSSSTLGLSRRHSRRGDRSLPERHRRGRPRGTGGGFHPGPPGGSAGAAGRARRRHPDGGLGGASPAGCLLPGRAGAHRQRHPGGRLSARRSGRIAAHRDSLGARFPGGRR